MARELPTGTVTFLFTDIEGSTRLLEELGAGYEDVLAEHRRVLRDALEQHRGAEVDTQGDAFFAAFASARDAVAAAEEIQSSLAASPARARMGLHTGEASAGPDGYVGMDVHRAARICAAAHGGQVLLSQSTRDLVDERVRDVGEHRLKDLTAPQRLHQLLIAGLQDDFPPLRTLERRPTNLPVQQAPLIGRDRELREARELLAGTRLLTLTGAGGVGKTRLALQLAADLLEEFEDGVFVVDVANVADPELALLSLAQKLGVSQYVRDKRLLLVPRQHGAAPRGRSRGELLTCVGARVEAAGHEPRAPACLRRAGVSGASAAVRRRDRAVRRARGRCVRSSCSTAIARPSPRSAIVSTRCRSRSSSPRPA